MFADDGARFSREQLGDALAATWRQIQREKPGDRYGGVSGEPEFWRDFLGRVRRLLDGGAVSDEAFARLAVYFREPEVWAVYPDVIATLEALAASGLSLGIVSNWDSHLPRILEGRGLRPFFQAVSVSAIEETGKPEPEIFLRTCGRLSIAAQEALHVGDSLRDDFHGARAAGLAALLLDRKGQFPEVADRIQSLSEIPGRLAGGHGVKSSRGRAGAV